MELLIRPYTGADAPACFAIFEGNTPDYFAPSERGEFAAYLADPRGGLLVAEAGGVGVVGVGGYYLRGPAAPGAAASGTVASGTAASGAAPEGGLAWGMVARAWHRRGVGGALLAARLAALWSLGASAASVRTSQRSRGFFERAGFAPVRTVPAGFAPGIDLVELRLTVPSQAGAAARAAERGVAADEAAPPSS